MLETAAWPASTLASRVAPPTYDPYPERQFEKLTTLDRKIVSVFAPFFRRIKLPSIGSYRRRVARCNLIARHLQNLTDAELDGQIRRLRASLCVKYVAPDQIERALALVREISARTLGMRPFDVQMMAALSLLDGRLAEMETGEGKSLVAAISAATAGLSGTSTHVVSVNDYLAARDVDTFGPLFARLGLSFAAIKHEDTPDQRREIYARNIIYVSNKEIAFDYLRDRVRMAGTPSLLTLKLNRLLGQETALNDRPVLNGLHFAIVDEADSVLVDEARTPLILSQETDAAAEEQQARQTFSLLDRLEQGADFKVDLSERRATLTQSGKAHLEKLSFEMDDSWKNKIHREEAVRQAIQARFLFHEGDQYVVRDDKVVIVDEYTGRLMPERSWSNGLHQLVEAKENVPVTPQKSTIARMTYQRFFSRYLKLAGMTGTAREVAREMSSTYDIDYIRIPTRKDSQMKKVGTRVARDEMQKLELILEQVQEKIAQNQPVLVGTRSVAVSQAVSEVLQSEGIGHAVLNALNDEDEASVIAKAGKPGCVTVATNMAGRGVHIDIPAHVEAMGGLHVILTERHDSTRIDRQLMGRTARQGQRGSFEAILARDDAILAGSPAPVAQVIGYLGGPFRQTADLYRFRKAQRRATRINARARRALLEHDRHLERLLAFAGGSE